MSQLSAPLLFVVTEPMPDLLDRVASAVRGGVDVVIWRDKTTLPESRGAMAAPIRRAAGSAKLLVNGPAELARMAMADGIHLTETAPRLDSSVSAEFLVGRSVHSLEAALRAAGEGADYLLVGTLFSSTSHLGKDPEGLSLLSSITSETSAPAIGIGGITQERIGECLRAGASGVAVISGVLHAADPEAAAREYKTRLFEGWNDVGRG